MDHFPQTVCFAAPNQMHRRLPVERLMASRSHAPTWSGGINSDKAFSRRPISLDRVFACLVISED
jgi:hypothetical protein